MFLGQFFRRWSQGQQASHRLQVPLLKLLERATYRRPGVDHIVDDGHPFPFGQIAESWREAIVHGEQACSIVGRGSFFGPRLRPLPKQFEPIVGGLPIHHGEGDPC